MTDRCRRTSVRAIEAGRPFQLALLALVAYVALFGWTARASAVTFTSKPFADNRPGTTIRDVVVRGSDNHVWLNTFNGTNWNGWLDLGGDVRGRPTSVSFGSNHLDVFARDSANHLMHRWWNGTSFSNWEPIGGAWQFVGDPIPVSWGNGRIDIFARGTDNALIHLYTAGAGWSTWESLGGSLAYDPAVDTAGANNLDIFTVDGNGFLAHKYFVGYWSTWQPLGAWQYTSAPTAATTGLRAGAFARGTDAAMGAVWWTSAGWSGPFSLGSPGGITGQPSAITFGDPIIAVFARGQADNRLYQMWYNGANNTWNGWGNVGGPWVMSTDPYAIAWGGNREDVFSIGNDGSLIHTWFDGTAWQPWENLGAPRDTFPEITVTDNGATPPAPTTYPTYPTTPDEDSGATAASVKCSPTVLKLKVVYTSDKLHFKLYGHWLVTCPGYVRGAPREIGFTPTIQGDFDGYYPNGFHWTGPLVRCYGTRSCEYPSTSTEYIAVENRVLCIANQRYLSQWSVNAAILSPYYVNQNGTRIDLGSRQGLFSKGLQGCDY